jgi:hypothetical protein
VGCKMYRFGVRKKFTKLTHVGIVLRYVREIDSEDDRRRRLAQDRAQ